MARQRKVMHSKPLARLDDQKFRYIAIALQTMLDEEEDEG